MEQNLRGIYLDSLADTKQVASLMIYWRSACTNAVEGSEYVEDHDAFECRNSRSTVFAPFSWFHHLLILCNTLNPSCLVHVRVYKQINPLQHGPKATGTFVLCCASQNWYQVVHVISSTAISFPTYLLWSQQFLRLRLWLLLWWMLWERALSEPLHKCAGRQLQCWAFQWYTRSFLSRWKLVHRIFGITKEPHACGGWAVYTWQTLLCM